MTFLGEVLINNNIPQNFSFHGLLDYSIFHNKRNINITFLLFFYLLGEEFVGEILLDKLVPMLVKVITEVVSNINRITRGHPKTVSVKYPFGEAKIA